MIRHPAEGRGLSPEARAAFDEIAAGNNRWHEPKHINALLRVGLIMRHAPGAIRKEAWKQYFEAGTWVLTPDAWAMWIEYERQRSAEYVKSEELQPADVPAIPRKATA